MELWRSWDQILPLLIRLISSCSCHIYTMWHLLCEIYWVSHEHLNIHIALDFSSKGILPPPFLTAINKTQLFKTEAEDSSLNSPLSSHWLLSSSPPEPSQSLSRFPPPHNQSSVSLTCSVSTVHLEFFSLLCFNVTSHPSHHHLHLTLMIFKKNPATLK